MWLWKPINADCSSNSSYRSDKQLLEQPSFEIAHLVQFLFGCHNPLVKHGKNVNNRRLFVHRRLVHAYVGQLRIFQIPCVRGQALRELLKLLNEPPILERISPESRVLSTTRVYHRICRADNTSPRRNATCALPHTHGVVHDVARKHFLVIAFIFAGTVLLVCVGLPFDTVVYCDGKQFVRCAASFRSFLENVAYSYLSPIYPRFTVSIRHAAFLPEDGALQSSFMLLADT